MSDNAAADADKPIGVSIKSGKILDSHFQLFQRLTGKTSTIDNNETTFSILILIFIINFLSAAATTSRNSP
ncbi:MAG: hypothetical protein ABI690_05150 [Chloroflexota bacterium]